MRRRPADSPTPAAPPGAPTPPSLPRRGVLPLDPEDWAWLHDLINRNK
jgi:hypothetical protein